MREDLKKIWDEAARNPGKDIPVGNIVVCDGCSEDYTDSPETGGLIMMSKAFCPKCQPKVEADIAKYKEERFVKARCPVHVPFADFVRDYRGPDSAIRITTGKP